MALGANLWQFIDDEGLNCLNQLQIINVVKRFYGDVSAYIPGGQKAIKMRPKTSVLSNGSSGHYAEHYARVKEMANEKKWT